MNRPVLLRGAAGAALVRAAGVCAAGLFAATGPALAQTVDTTNATAAGPAAGSSASVSEVVVTGQKRSEQLINTPVVTQVFGEKAIQEAGIKTPEDFLRMTPNVNFYTAENQGDFLINIRGQTSVRTAEPSVALIVDGVPVASAAEFNTALFDLQQIEVLKGPQGAYYGRDASAGAIILTTKAPGDVYSGQATVDYGSFNTINVNASVGGPIIADKLAFRAAISDVNTDGPYRDVNTGENVDRLHEVIGRGRLDWTVNDKLKLDFRVAAGHGQGGALAYTPDIGISAVTPTGTLVHGVSVTQAGSNIDYSAIPYTSDVFGRYQRDLFSTALKADYSLPFATLTSITAYSQTLEKDGAKNLPYSDNLDPFTNLGAWASIFGDKTQNYANNNYSIDQEFRLTSSLPGFIQWQAGFQFVARSQDYVTDSELNGAIPAGLTGAALAGYNGFTNGVRTLVGNGYSAPWPLQIQGLNTPYATTAFDRAHYTGQDVAPFANVDVNITDRLQLRLAGRYDVERRTVNDYTPNTPNPFDNGLTYNECVLAGVGTAAACAAGESKTFAEFEPKVTLDYKIPAFGTVYASWGRSFKTGGFNQEGTRDEAISSYDTLYLAEGQSPATALANAKASVVAQDYYQKEVDDTWEAGFKTQLFEKRLFAEGAFFYTDVSNAQTYTFDPVSNVQAIESIDKERIYGVDFDVNARVTNAFTVYGGIGWINSRITRFAAAPADVGNTPPYAAEYTANVGGQYVQPLKENLNLVVRIDYEVTGPTWFDVANTPGTRRNAYGLTDFRLGLATDKYEITAFGKNVFNTPYLTDNFPISSSIDALSRGMPASYGIELKARF